VSTPIDGQTKRLRSYPPIPIELTTAVTRKYTFYEEMLYGVALCLTRNRDDAERLTCDALTAAVRCDCAEGEIRHPKMSINLCAPQLPIGKGLCDFMLSKADIRKRFLDARRALTKQEVASRSLVIMEQLAPLPQFQEARVTLSYIPSRDNEVDILPLIHSKLDEGMTVLVPVTMSRSCLVWSRLKAFCDLAPARFDIVEPRPECHEFMTPPENSVVLVPGIAFSFRGERIGYGGGYFDRFLAHFHGCKIGLAFDLQMTESIPSEAHDIPMDIIVTEAAVYYSLGSRFLPA